MKSRRKPRGTTRETAYRARITKGRSFKRYPNTGQAHLEYAWEHWQKTGNVMLPCELEQAIDSGELGRWIARKNGKRVVSRAYFLDTADGRKIPISREKLRKRPEKKHSSDYRREAEEYKRRDFNARIREQAFIRLAESGLEPTESNLKCFMDAVSIEQNFSEALKSLRKSRQKR